MVQRSNEGHPEKIKIVFIVHDMNIEHESLFLELLIKFDVLKLLQEHFF